MPDFQLIRNFVRFLYPTVIFIYIRSQDCQRKWTFALTKCFLLEAAMLQNVKMEPRHKLNG